MFSGGGVRHVTKCITRAFCFSFVTAFVTLVRWRRGRSRRAAVRRYDSHGAPEASWPPGKSSDGVRLHRGTREPPLVMSRRENIEAVWFWLQTAVFALLANHAASLLPKKRRAP